MVADEPGKRGDSRGLAERVGGATTWYTTKRGRYEQIDRTEFLEEILKSRRELHISRQQFDQVSDPYLVDHIVFRIGAAERHLSYLFRIAKEQNISFEGAEWVWTSDTWRLD